jgi:hypothetical protein
MAELLLYGAPAVAVAVTCWAGFLGWRFYFREVINNEGDQQQ